MKWKWSKDNQGELPELEKVKVKGQYVYEDTWNDKKIIIKPYINFYPETYANALDWMINRNS